MSRMNAEIQLTKRRPILSQRKILRKGFYAINTNSVEAMYRESSSSISGNKISAFIWTWNIYRKELKLNIYSSCFHFIIYSIKAVIKFLK